MNKDKIQQIKARYGIVGTCEALDRAIDISLQVAMTDLSVLITGENGTGKEVFPRIIHDNSARKSRKYFAVNCGSIPEGTIDSELFGHEKGAFTGAVNERQGYFAAANGGTLFLDEVGELPLSTQARLLRVLETGEYIRVGSSEVRKTDVRIVAATNVDLPKAIEDGRFRQDLYYRLNTIPVSIPPLRDRGEDVIKLFRRFALEMSEKYNMPCVKLTPEASELLLNYPWPGNVRELKNVTENISVTSPEREITAETLSKYLPSSPSHALSVTHAPKEKEKSYATEREILYQILFDLRRDVSELKRRLEDNDVHSPKVREMESDGEYIEAVEASNTHSAQPYNEIKADDHEREKIIPLEEQEKTAIIKALTACGGKRKEAADSLGISERTLYRKIKEYDLEK